MSLSYEILSYLYGCGYSPSAADLGEHLSYLDIILATTLLERLEQKGLVIKRGKRYRITEKGIRTVRDKNGRA